MCFFFLNQANGANQANQLEKKYIVSILVFFDQVTACKKRRTSILAFSVGLHFCLLCLVIPKKKCVHMRKPCGLVYPVRLVCNKETPVYYTKCIQHGNLLNANTTLFGHHLIWLTSKFDTGTLTVYHTHCISTEVY